MTRYTYDNLTFRLVRQRTETYNHEDAWVFTPGGSVKRDTAYRYDLAGNIIETTENRTDAGFGTTLVGGQGPTPNKLVREFDYHPLYRLILATGREDTSHSHNLIWQDTTPVSPTPANSREYRRTYQYDKMGNILKLSHTAHQASFTRNFGYHTSMDHNKLEKVLDNNQNTLTDFLYDAAGNTIQNNSERFYIWDAANQLKQFKIDDGQTVSVYGQHLYSGGQRVKKLVKDQQGNSTTTVYIDGVFEYQKLVKGANTYERNYTHVMDDRSRIATVRAGSDEDDITEDAFYVVEDHLNTSTARLKATDGSVIDREEFYPFGETCLHSFSKKRYRYTGKEKDSESGLYFFGARYYAPWTCRFISVDPLAADYPYLTPYNYAGNKPITHKDIDGLQSTGDQKVENGGGEESNGGTQDTSNNTNQNVLVNGHSGDLKSAQERVDSARNSVIEKRDDLYSVNPNDRKGYKKAQKKLNRANKDLQKAYDNLDRVQSTFDIVQKEIDKALELDDKFFYTEKMIENLTTADESFKPYGIKKGDEISPLQTLQQLDVQITVYFGKSDQKDQYGLLSPATNRRLSESSHRIDLSSGLTEVAVFNEVGDIFFGHRFGELEEVDKATKNHAMKSIHRGDPQAAYLSVYHSLHKEKFSAALETQAKKLLK